MWNLSLSGQRAADIAAVAVAEGDMDDTEDLVIFLFSVRREKGDRERAGGHFTDFRGNHADALHRVVGQLGHRQTGFRVVGGIGIKLNFHPFDVLVGGLQGEIGGLGHAVPLPVISIACAVLSRSTSAPPH